ncbi:major yolk protein-like [Montipora capricornis]|uniref:major yolk protein-like n=1 Tax=Montipora capricornis TaxID=246305 RepID=UPI0035F18D20
MKAFVLLLCFAIALVHGFPGRKSWGNKKRTGHANKPINKAEKHFDFENWKVRQDVQREQWKEPVRVKMGRHHHTAMDDAPSVRWCVISPCELEKCKRMATEFNYMVNPHLHWSCVMEKSKEACMEDIKTGQADVMMAEGDEIYKASRMYDGLIPIMTEKYSDTYQKHYSIVLARKDNSDINSFLDMAQKKSCHYGMDTMASFKTPMCSLIHDGVVPKVGNVFDSAGEFFKESCVPGVQHVNYNPNMTNPDSLCRLCKGPKDDFDFCMTLSDKEPHYGFTGALKCLRDNHGDVGFFHSYDVMKNFQALSQEFELVCKKAKKSLDWDNINDGDCHLAEEHPQVLIVSKDKPKEWITLCIRALENASKTFSSPGTITNGFTLFDSSPYCAKNDHEDDHHKGEEKIVPEETTWKVQNWMKSSHLIFKDYSSSLETIHEENRTLLKFLDRDIWKTCEQLEPKPRAFICVVGDKEVKKCKMTIDSFQGITELRQNVSWGCVKASSKKECVDLVAKNLADIVDLNATEMFMAGIDHNLAPFMGKNYKGKAPWTESITIGVKLRQDKRELSEDMSGWKMCNGGIHKINGFLHPMGWLMANGTIERSGSPLKSVVDHFGESCVPGMKSVDLIKHPLFSRTFDWDMLLQKVKWEDWYTTPLWIKWQDKEAGAVNDYQSMHDVHDFESPEFQKMTQILMSEQPTTNVHLTPKIQDLMEMVKKDFSWDHYGGVKDFYGMEKPGWNMISWVWEKPADWTEIEWQLFLSWAGKIWDQKEDLEHYTSNWMDNAWTVFKTWIDHEYNDYTQDHKPLHKDIFIRFSLLSDRYHWLLQQWQNLQWNDINLKYYRERLCDLCAGLGDNKCSTGADEDYYDYHGALKCLKEGDGDVAFIDWYTFDDAITQNAYNKDEFVLLCPDGKTVPVTGIETVKECNFGRVPSSALATCNMHDGVWRWRVTKALLHAQKTMSTEMFKYGIFGSDTEDLSSIPLINQTYQVWLGPMFLLAMEGIMQPTVQRKSLQDNVDIITVDCEGHECDHDQLDLPSCDECEEDLMCKQHCWKVEPSVDDKTNMRKGHAGKKEKMMKKMTMKMKMRNVGEDWMTPQDSPEKRMGMKKKPEVILWKPEGLKIYPIVHRSMHMGLFSMRGNMKTTMGGKVSMKYGMKMPGMMHHDENNYMGPMKYGLKPMKHVMGPMVPVMMHTMPVGSMKCLKTKGKMMGYPGFTKDKILNHQGVPNHNMETGPIMRSQKSIRGEFYSNVVFARNGTCNVIVRDLRCFGEKKYIRMWAGRVSKTLISVPMCPRPTDIKKTTAQFTCNTGASFIKSVQLPVRCSYVPCNPGFWVPQWTDDHYWDRDNSFPGNFWGNQEWWKFDQRGDNDNWFLSSQDSNRLNERFE